MGRSDDGISFEILHDFGAFGDGKWQKHLTYIKWGDNEPKFDIRSWNEDMTKCGKGVTLNDSEVYDLSCLLEEALDSLSDKEPADE